MVVIQLPYLSIETLICHQKPEQPRILIGIRFPYWSFLEPELVLLVSNHQVSDFVVFLTTAPFCANHFEGFGNGARCYISLLTHGWRLVPIHEVALT